MWQLKEDRVISPSEQADHDDCKLDPAGPWAARAGADRGSGHLHVLPVGPRGQVVRGSALFVTSRLLNGLDSLCSAECEPISLTYVITGVLPTWMNGRNDKMGTVQGLWECANKYKEHHPGFVVVSFCLVYISLQTFAIPGPIVLSILSGAMYPFLEAQVLVAFCATTGASLCFALSYFLGRGIFNRLFSSMIARFKEKVRLGCNCVLHVSLLTVLCA